MGASTADTYATIYPTWYSHFLSTGVTVSQERVSQMARQQLQRQNPQYADNPMILRMVEQRVGQQLVQQQVLLAEAERIGISASDNDVSAFLHKGQFGEFLFPNGQFIGTDRYSDFVARQFNLSIAQFEQEVKQDIITRRLLALVTAGVTVSGQEVRDSYRKANVKIKFEYAVVASDDLRKTIKLFTVAARSVNVHENVSGASCEESLEVFKHEGRRPAVKEALIARGARDGYAGNAGEDGLSGCGASARIYDIGTKVWAAVDA